MRRVKKSERGVSLVETMVAATIIAITVLGTTGTYIMAAKNSSLSWQRSTAQHLLAQRLDRLRLADQATLEALPQEYRLDTRFDRDSSECPAGKDCPSLGSRFTSCIRRLTTAPADPSAPGVTQVLVRVAWTTPSAGATTECPPDDSLGGPHVSYVFTVAR